MSISRLILSCSFKKRRVRRTFYWSSLYYCLCNSNIGSSHDIYNKINNSLRSCQLNSLPRTNWSCLVQQWKTNGVFKRRIHNPYQVWKRWAWPKTSFSWNSKDDPTTFWVDAKLLRSCNLWTYEDDWNCSNVYFKKINKCTTTGEYGNY